MTENSESGFVDSVPPKVADNYRRLNADKRLAPVFKKLKKRGLKVRGKELLLRRIALLQQDWESEKEGWKKRQKRRAGMAKKLRKLEKEAAADPDLSRLRTSVDEVAINCPPGSHEELQSFTDVLNIGASILESSISPLIEGDDDKTLTLDEYEQLHDRKGSIKEPAFVLLGIFELLQPYFEAVEDARPPRVPNKETEALGAVLLQKDIRPGTVTKLREDVRHEYYREPK